MEIGIFFPKSSQRIICSSSYTLYLYLYQSPKLQYILKIIKKKTYFYKISSTLVWISLCFSVIIEKHGIVFVREKSSVMKGEVLWEELSQLQIKRVE